MSRWSTTRTSPTAKQQREAQRIQALADCQKGDHTFKDTLTDGVRLCQWCALTLVCPICNPAYLIQHPHQQRAYEMRCTQHQRVEVQPCP